MNNRGWTEALLNEEGLLEPERLRDLERRITMIIDKRQRQVKRMRWAVGLAWGLLIILFVAGATIESVFGRGLAPATIAVLLPGTFWIALFLTASWYVRSVSLNFRHIQDALTAIQHQLAELRGDSSNEGSR